MTGRDVVWWSAGAASTIAARLHLADHPDSILVYTDPGSEHPDNVRFRAAVEEWLGVEITVLRSDEYVDTWDVWDRTGWLVGAGGARCTVELKKRLRQRFQRHDDRQVFGYTVEEQHRVERFRAANPEVNLVTPLIDAHLTKADCLALVARAGIPLPVMYELGYPNANCVGCPHGSVGYWNMIRRDFPDVFDRMARLERRLDNAVCRPGGGSGVPRRTRPQPGGHPFRTGLRVFATVRGGRIVTGWDAVWWAKVAATLAAALLVAVGVSYATGVSVPTVWTPVGVIGLVAWNWKDLRR